MSKLKQIIQLQSSNLSVRELSRVLSMSVGAVSKYLAMARAAGLTLEAAQGLDETALERRIFGEPAPAAPGRFAPVDLTESHGRADDGIASMNRCAHGDVLGSADHDHSGR